MSFQRAGKMKSATMNSGTHVNMLDLIRFLKEAKEDLENHNEPDSALRFEIAYDYFMKEYKGGEIKTKRALGL
jgi:hypothetical protein